MCINHTSDSNNYENNYENNNEAIRGLHVESKLSFF
jgi:hypothetical protein